VIALRAGEQPELLGPAEGVPGGAAFVDHEGSLWAGTAGGLVQIPEPETVIWNQRDGLLHSARYLGKTEEGVWIATWAGLCRLTSASGSGGFVDEKLEHKWPLTVDGEGHLWGKHRDTFLQRAGRGFKRYPVPGSGIIHSSALASDGTLWIGTDRGLFKTNREESAPVLFGKPAGVDTVDQVLEDSRGELWVTSDNKICHARQRRSRLQGKCRGLATRSMECPSSQKSFRLPEAISGPRAGWAGASGAMSQGIGKRYLLRKNCLRPWCPIWFPRSREESGYWALDMSYALPNGPTCPKDGRSSKK
jgi:hypothetical protein